MDQTGMPAARDSRPSRRPPSIAPSISSVLSNATTITAPVHVQRGFKSREAYLAALNEFAESKLYMPAGDHTLHGWYGGKTMDDYKNRPGLREGKKKRKESRSGQDKEGNTESSATMAVVPEVAEEFAGAASPERTASGERSAPLVDDAQKQGKFRRLSRVFAGGRRRRATVA